MPAKTNPKKTCCPSCPLCCCPEKFLPWLLAVLFTVLILASAIYAYRIYLSRQVHVWREPPFTEAPTETPISSIDTSAWQTYKNDQYGFKFKYPTYLVTKNELLSPSTGGVVKLNIFVSFKPLFDLRTTSEHAIRLEQEDFAQIENRYGKIGERDTIKVDNKSGIRRQLSLGKEGLQDIEFVYFNFYGEETPRDSIAFRFYGQEKQLFDQILSTFKFLNSTSSTDTSTWQTYKNNQYGFEIKYPQNWILKLNQNSLTPFAYISNKKDFLIPISYFENQKGVVNPITQREDVFDPKKENFDEISKNIYLKRNVVGDDGSTGDEYRIMISTERYLAFSLPIKYASNNVADIQDIEIGRQILSTFKFLDSTSSTNTSAWKTYTNKNLGIELKYPKQLLLSSIDRGINLKHSIFYKHGDFCNLKEEKMINDMVDFDLKIQIFTKNLKETIQNTNSHTLDSLYKNGQLMADSPGYFERISIAELNGYKLWQGVEGCGEIDYYFPLSDSKTLYLSRSLVGELSNTSGLKDEYLKLPGIISPTQEENYFSQILSTFKFLN